MKLKLIVAALALVAAGNAHAVIEEFSTGNGELFFNIYDPTVKQSFVFDLSPIATAPTMGTFNLNNFLPGDLNNVQGYTGVVAGELVPGTVATPDGRSAVEQNGVSFSWAINTSTPQWTSFINSGVTASNLKWNVVAGDQTGTSTTKHAQRFLTTVAPGVTALNPNSGQFSNLKLTNRLPNLINADNPGDAADASYHSFDTPDPVDNKYFGDGFTENWLGNLPENSTANVNQSMDFYYITGRSTLAITEQYETDAKWNFSLDANNNGILTYSTSAVPVPAAVWLLGSGLIGMVGVARRRKAA